MANQRHTRETKRLASLRVHWFAFDEARSAAINALKFADGLMTDLRLSRSLSFQAITAYGRPFRSSEGVNGFKGTGDRQLIDLHDEITAHNDALHHVYTMRVTVRNGEAVNETPVPHLLPFMTRVIAESEKQLKFIEQQAHDTEEHIRTLKLTDGFYEG